MNRFRASIILSELLTHLMAKQQDGLIDIVKRVSPVAWRHVNLGGRFKFNSKRQVPIEMEEVK